jgi:flagellar hook-associated protein 3 FlgL
MLTSFGDLAQAFQSQRQSAALKSTGARLTTELTTGRAQDLGRALEGDFGPLAELGRALAGLEAFRLSSAEATRFSGAMQAATGRLQALGADSAPMLLQAGTNGGAAFVDAAGAAARQSLDAALSALNTRDGGRGVFSGVASTGPAVVDRAALMGLLAPLVATETTAAGVVQAVEGFFDAPTGGFGDLGYLGADDALAPFRVAPGEAVALPVTAADPAIRETLKGLVLGALLEEGVFSADPPARAELARSAGERLLTADTGLAQLQGRIGAAEARIGAVQTRIAAEMAGLELRRAEIAGVDSYETASALQQTQAQLEMLFTVTARLSTLKLSDFL